MGNSLGGKKTTKVMKINGETFKLKTPVKAEEVVKDHPGHVLLESEAVKHYGTRAKPLEPHQDLVPKRLYFLVELPKAPTERNPRRVRSGINMSAKDRLESLMLSRRSVSDLSIIKQSSSIASEDSEPTNSLSSESNSSATRVKLRLPRAQVEKLMQECKDEEEVAAKIVNLCIENTRNNIKNGSNSRLSGDEDDTVPLKQQEMQWTSGQSRVREGVVKTREKRVSFMPISEGEMQIAVASY